MIGILSMHDSIKNWDHNNVLSGTLKRPLFTSNNQ